MKLRLFEGLCGGSDPVLGPDIIVRFTLFGFPRVKRLFMLIFGYEAYVVKLRSFSGYFWTKVQIWV